MEETGSTAVPAAASTSTPSSEATTPSPGASSPAQETEKPPGECGQPQGVGRGPPRVPLLTPLSPAPESVGAEELPEDDGEPDAAELRRRRLQKLKSPVNH